MSVNDIPYHQPPNAGSPASRFTLQYIQPSRVGTVLHEVCPHNSDARQPQDTSQWPPAIIVDLTYAAALLKAWSPKTFIKYVKENSQDSYYGGGEEEEEEKEEKELQTDCAIQYERQSAKKKQVVDPADQPTGEDMDIFDVVLALWMQAAKESNLRGKKRSPGNDAADTTDNKNKIQMWLQSVEEESTL